MIGPVALALKGLNPTRTTGPVATAARMAARRLGMPGRSMSTAVQRASRLRTPTRSNNVPTFTSSSPFTSSRLSQLGVTGHQQATFSTKASSGSNGQNGLPITNKTISQFNIETGAKLREPLSAAETMMVRSYFIKKEKDSDEFSLAIKKHLANFNANKWVEGWGGKPGDVIQGDY